MIVHKNVIKCFIDITLKDWDKNSNASSSKHTLWFSDHHQIKQESLFSRMKIKMCREGVNCE